jgi:uncharacterized damage-inducible protein DinB
MTDTVWTAPEVDRPDGLNVAPERAAVEEQLEYHRATLLWKCQGLTADQLKQRSMPPSVMSLLGLVRHMADVERWWFRCRIDGQDLPSLYWTDDVEDADFEVADADAAADLATYRAEVEAAREVLARHDFDDTFVRVRGDGREDTIDIRAIALHMVQEYARHNGHADLLREGVDGVTGD